MTKQFVPFRTLCSPGQNASDQETDWLRCTCARFHPDPDAFERLTHLRDALALKCRLTQDKPREFALDRRRARRLVKRSVRLNRELAGIVRSRHGHFELEISDPLEFGFLDKSRMPVDSRACGNYHTHPGRDARSLAPPSATDMAVYVQQHMCDNVSQSFVFADENGSVRIYACSLFHVLRNPADGPEVGALTREYFEIIEQLFESDHVTHSAFKKMYVMACKYLGGIFAMYESKLTRR